LDRCGIGLSDRDREFDFSDLVLDIEAVVRRERLERFALVARASSAAVAIVYALKYPEQVSDLVLFCPYIPDRDLKGSSPPHEAVRAAAAKHWETYTQLLAELTTGWVDMDEANRYAAYLQDCSGSNGRQGFMERFTDSDLTCELSQLKMPVLVLQRKDAIFPTVENARKAAASPALRAVGPFGGPGRGPFPGQHGRRADVDLRVPLGT